MVRAILQIYGHSYLAGNSNGQRWFEIVNNNIEEVEDNDIAF